MRTETQRSECRDLGKGGRGAGLLSEHFRVAVYSCEIQLLSGHHLQHRYHPGLSVCQKIVTMKSLEDVHRGALDSPV